MYVVMHSRPLTELSQRTGSVFEKSYQKILFAGALNTRLEASMFYCLPTSSCLLTLLKTGKTIHISSFILRLRLCANKSILGDLMKQYVLGGSFEESSTQFFVFNTRGLCVNQIDKKHIKPSLVDQCCHRTSLSQTRSCVTGTFEMDVFRGFWGCTSGQLGQRKLEQSCGTISSFQKWSS